MKKIICLLLCLSMVLLVVGCSKIDETWKDMTGGPEVPVKWETVDSEVSPDGSVDLEDTTEVTLLDTEKLEVPEFNSTALKFVVYEQKYGMRNTAACYSSVNIDYKNIINGLVKLKDSSSDEEIESQSIELANMLNDNLNLGFDLSNGGSLETLSDLSKNYSYVDLDGKYILSIIDDKESDSSIILKTGPFILDSKSKLLEEVKKIDGILNTDMASDSSFVRALNDLSLSVPLDDLNTDKYNNLFVNIFDATLDRDVCTYSIYSEIDGDKYYYFTTLSIRLSKSWYEEIKLGNKFY